MAASTSLSFCSFCFFFPFSVPFLFPYRCFPFLAAFTSPSESICLAIDLYFCTCCDKELISLCRGLFGLQHLLPSSIGSSRSGPFSGPYFLSSSGRLQQNTSCAAPPILVALGALLVFSLMLDLPYFVSGKIDFLLTLSFIYWCLVEEKCLGASFAAEVVFVGWQGSFLVELCLWVGCVCLVFCCFSPRACGDSLGIILTRTVDFGFWSSGCLPFTRVLRFSNSFCSGCLTCSWLEWHFGWFFLCLFCFSAFCYYPTFAGGESFVALILHSIDSGLSRFECLPFIWGLLCLEIICLSYLARVCLVMVEEQLVCEFGIAVVPAVFRNWKGEVSRDLDQIDLSLSSLVADTKLIHSDLCLTLLSAPLYISFVSNAAASLQPIRSPSPCCSLKSLPILVDLKSMVRSHTHFYFGIRRTAIISTAGFANAFPFFHLFGVCYSCLFFMSFLIVCNLLVDSASTGVVLFPLG